MTQKIFEFKKKCQEHTVRFIKPCQNPGYKLALDFGQDK